MSTDMEETTLLQESRKEEEEGVYRSEHTTAVGMDMFNLYNLLDGCAKSFCA